MPEPQAAEPEPRPCSCYHLNTDRRWVPAATTWRGVSVSVASIYWPPWAAREAWRDLVTRTAAAIRAMPRTDLLIVGGDWNAELSPEAARHSTGASATWRRALAADFIAELGARDTRPTEVTTATRQPWRSADRQSAIDHFVVRGDARVELWSVNQTPEVSAFSDHGIIFRARGRRPERYRT